MLELCPRHTTVYGHVLMQGRLILSWLCVVHVSAGRLTTLKTWRTQLPGYL